MFANSIRSFALLTLTFAIVLGLVFGGIWLFEGAIGKFVEPQDVVWARTMARYMAWLPYVLPATIVWIAGALVFNGYLIRWTSSCDLVSPGTEPRLERILQRLCRKAKMDVPQLGVIETDQLNAFATGIFANDRLVAVTRGLADHLSDDEIEAVMAHELAHIRHHDVMLGVIAATVAGGIVLMIHLFIALVTRCIFLVIRIFRNDEEGEGMAGFAAFVIGFLFIAIAGLIATVISFALSRTREFMADAGAAEMTGNPRALISALEKIEEHCALSAPSTVMQLCISRPRQFLDLFSTHPPTEDRIAKLALMPQRASAESPQRAAQSTRGARQGFGRRAATI
jgi:heat shock protein HtpX